MGRPQRSAAAGPSRRSARAAVPIKNERITRSSRSKHNFSLDDPEQVERDLNAQLKLMGLYAANTTGDGNCLFRALSDQLYGHPTRYAQLRQETCDHLAAWPDKFAGFVDDKPFDQYVRQMRENGTYGGHLELHAFAQMKQKQIKIVQPGLVYVVEDDSPEARRAREEREKERLRVQNTIQVTDAAPLTERQRRRQKREDTKRDKQASKLPAIGEASTSASASTTAAAASTSSEAVPPAASQESQASTLTPASSQDTSTAPLPPQLAEAYGPLYIAYHNWEHYSSVRNLDGPHSGLPRIKEQTMVAAAAAAAGAGSESTAKDSANDAEPTTEEKMVLQSISGDHDLQEVRRLLRENDNDWAHVVELLVEKDTIIDDEEEVGAELQAVPSSSSIALDRLAVPPPPPLPDHMRHWRATSPSSVDTSATHSSGEGESPSTTATTDDGGDTTACASPDASSLSRGSTPGVERLSSKRAASSDPMSMSMIRSPKRRSQSRSPDLDPTATAEAQAEAKATAKAASTPAEGNGQNEDAVYEIIKRGRGRPRKDGLPNKSTIAIKRRVPTAREKRDAAQARKRERQLEKVGRAKPDEGQSAAASNTNRPSPAEVCGFRELKI